MSYKSGLLKMYEDEPTTYDDDGKGGWHSVGQKTVPSKKSQKKKQDRLVKQQAAGLSNHGIAAHSNSISAATTPASRFQISFEMDPKSASKVPSKGKIARQKLKNKRASKKQKNQPLPNVKLTEETIKRTIREAIERFPQSANQQLIMVTDALEEALCSQKEFDPKTMIIDEINSTDDDDEDDLIFGELNEKPLYIMVTEPVRKVVGAFFTKISKEELSRFFWFLLLQIIDTGKGKNSSQLNGNGIRSMLQLLLQKQPIAIFRDPSFENEINEFLVSPNEKPISHLQKIPPISQLISKSHLPTFLWIFSQVIVKQPTLALSLWYQYILPHLFYQSYEMYHKTCIEYLQYLLEFNEEISHPKSEIFVIGYERLLVLNYSLLSHDKSPFQYRINDCYEAIKLTILHNNLVPRNYFEMLLSHAAISSTQSDFEENLREEVCFFLAKCLECDFECYSRWEQIYPRFIIQSNNLLLYLNLNWHKSIFSLRVENIVKCAQSFISINNQILAGTYNFKAPKGVREIKIQKQSVNLCSVTCKALIKEAKKSTSKTLLNIFLFVLLIALGYFGYKYYSGQFGRI